MLIYPAIDLRAGKCVRLVEGKIENETVYNDDPVAAAAEWERQGAAWLHVVDLDGAFCGKPVNLPVVKEIVRSIGIPVQFGGGVRDLKTIETLLAAGVARIVIGTAAINNSTLVKTVCNAFGERIAIGIDAKDGYVAVRGWVETTPVLATELIKTVVSLGVSRVIYTDIGRDGKLSGPNLQSIENVLKNAAIPVIASGGVGSMKDICALKAYGRKGLEGVIVGKALYTGKVNLAEAIRILQD